MAEFEKSVPDDIDLLIDDGLHSPDANIRSVVMGLTKVKKGGWIVIEDIKATALPIWHLAASLIPTAYEAHLVRGLGGYLFVIKK